MQRTIFFRPCPGAGSLLVISAAFLPIWMLVANAHLSHWEGGHLPNAYELLVVPYGLKCWGILMGGLCAGTMAYWSAQSPQWVSIRHVLARNTLVFLGVLLVVLPGITWMVRLGHLDFGATLSTWSRICLPIVATALVSTLVGLRTNGQFGTMAGGLVFVGMMMVTG